MGLRDRKTLNIRYPKENCFFDRPFPMPDFDFQPYLDFVQRNYSESQSLYTPTDAVLPLKVQSVEKVDRTSGEEGNDRQLSQKNEQFLVLDGLRKYALGDDREHVLLAGRPGSGKSMALQQLAVALAKEGQIPVLVQLKGDRSVSELIKAEFRRARVRVADDQIDEWLFADRLVLLLDGVNEIPTEKLRQDLAQFREDNLSVPMVFTARDLAIGGDLGIGKRFEMKPLSPDQLREFVGKYLPGQGERLLKQLRDRLKEISETPLLLKMLCDVFDPETGQIPQNKGELFREFDRKYEKFKGLPAVSVDFRRFKSEVLQHLAFVMMTGDEGKPTELELTIDWRTAEKAIEDFVVGRVSDPGAKAKEWLEDLLEHHLLQVATDDRRVEFRHQLFQEYYAAEVLLVMFNNHHLDVMEKDRFQHFYLNYLKWTETIAITLSLMKDEKEAVRVVELALDVDLMLGARLAGEVRFELQPKILPLIKKLKIPQRLKITLLGKTTFTSAISYLEKTLQNGDFNIRRRSIEALSNITSNVSTSILIEALNDLNENIRLEAIKALIDRDLSKETMNTITRKIQSDSAVVEAISMGAVKLNLAYKDILISNLNQDMRSQNTGVCIQAIELVKVLQLKPSIDLLLQLLKHENHEIGWKSAEELARIVDKSEINYLLEMLGDESVENRRRIIYLLGKIGGESITDCLCKVAGDDANDREIRILAIKALGEVGGESIVRFLVHVLKEERIEIRRQAIIALSMIKCQSTIRDIIPYLNDVSPEIREEAARLLGEIGDDKLTDILLNALNDEDSGVRKAIIATLGKIGNDDNMVSVLENSLLDPSFDVRDQASFELGQSGNNKNKDGFFDNEDNEEELGEWERLGRLEWDIGLEEEYESPEIDFSLPIGETFCGGYLGDPSDPIQSESYEFEDEYFRDTWIPSKLVMFLGNRDDLIGDEDLEDEELTDHYVPASDFAACADPRAIPYLSERLFSDGAKDVMEVIASIQAKCKFYNYEIQQAEELRKADRSSLEGGGVDPFAKIEDKLESIDRRTKQQMAEQPSTISISGGTFNGPVNLASNQGHQPTTIIDTQNNYFGTDEALQKQITDLQTFITELEAQHPNIQTEEQANQLVQQQLDQIQTQSPDRWQKLRHQMGILKAQFFNPERHVQAFKATVVEVTKAKWEESLIVKAIVTYLDKFSETPDKGA